MQYKWAIMYDIDRASYANVVLIPHFVCEYSLPSVKQFRVCNVSEQYSPLEMVVWQQLILGTG